MPSVKDRAQGDDRRDGKRHRDQNPQDRQQGRNSPSCQNERRRSELTGPHSPQAGPGSTNRVRAIDDKGGGRKGQASRCLRPHGHTRRVGVAKARGVRSHREHREPGTYQPQRKQGVKDVRR